ncbi:type IIs restriction endonuclease [Leptospirillum ferriphilum]|uniref:Type IIs restriction endonuclease n=1 Tax=Leptospirillum ferriphilum TaxID=178606 RepID=A0A094X5C6_9BACT|nr:AlwI family type II restriction endonuclease [Leptospirillum ferriphilum]KGA93759.1 type IIs restriction endonuclease [Leptospirillum ferriphilum]
MNIWLLGNTTVRSPFRLRDGLIALSYSSILGNLRGRENDVSFRDLLGEKGIVRLGSDETVSVGRKWRSALGKLGFLYPKISTSLNIPQSSLGSADQITPSGKRLIAASTMPAIQECFLRAMLANMIPSPIEKNKSLSPFSPIPHTLSVLLLLERLSGSSSLSFEEMALVVQCSNGNEDAASVVKNVLSFREKRSKAFQKRLFDKKEFDVISSRLRYKSETLKDYADTNFRYLKATGLIHASGRGIAIVPEKKLLIDKILQNTKVPESPLAYLHRLCNGSDLPTDDMDTAILVLKDYQNQLLKQKILFDFTGKPVDTPADIGVLLHEAEQSLFATREKDYALAQESNWTEIQAYLDLIHTDSPKKKISSEKEISIPKVEFPAYFEWTVWRAFLAIDSLVNKPGEARRFRIDQDFLPVGPAPGNGPDILLEFQDFILVVEVTLTANSRQEAAEGETVRRHVASVEINTRYQNNKPVYGLFIAKTVDMNTVDTFRRGIWFEKEKEMRLNIVPVDLPLFNRLFYALSSFQGDKTILLLSLLKDALLKRDSLNTTGWKEHIDAIFNNKIDSALHPVK